MPAQVTDIMIFQAGKRLALRFGFHFQRIHGGVADIGIIVAAFADRNRGGIAVGFCPHADKKRT